MEYKWTISLLECYPQQGENQNVVFNAHWRCTATLEEFTESVYGTCGLQLNPDSDYIPYEDLTEDIVLSWIWSSGVDKIKYEELLSKQIDSKVNPTILAPPLPWINLNK